MEAQPVTPGAALFSQEQLAALQRLRTAFEQKLLDEDEYKAEKAKVLNATPAAPPPPPADDDDDGFELVGVQTPAERAAESRRRAEAEGNVLEIDDDDDEPAAPAPAPAPRAGRFRAPERRRRVGPPAPRRNRRRGEERVMLRCRRVYFGTALRRDVTVVFAPSCVTMEWRSDTSGLYIETRLAPSHMYSFDIYYGPARGAGGDGEANPINLAGDDEMEPDAIRAFFAIGLRQKPPHLRSVEGFEPTDDAGPRKYVVVVLDGEALETFKREAIPAVVWGGHVGWPAAPVLGTAAAARPFLEGIPIADALAAADDAADAATGLRRLPPRAGAAPAAPPVRPRLRGSMAGRPAAGERRDFGLNLPPTASREAFRNAVGAFPGMAAHRRPTAPPVTGAPPLRRRDGPSVGELLEGPRPVAPSRDEGRWVRGAFTGSPPPRAPKPKAKKLSGFMLFSKEMRPNIIAADPGLSFGDVSKCLGELWRGLPDAEKARYNRTCVPA